MEMMRRTLGRSLEAWWTSNDSQAELEAQSKSTRVCLGVQEQREVKTTPWPHMESFFDVLYMDGKIISSKFQWSRNQAQIRLESIGITETRERLDLSRCCGTIFWAVGLCIELGSMMDVARALCTPQPSYI